MNAAASKNSSNPDAAAPGAMPDTPQSAGRRRSMRRRRVSHRKRTTRRNKNKNRSNKNKNRK